MSNSQYHNLFFGPKEKVENSEIVITGQEYHHIKHVLRKNIGDKIFMTDGNGRRYHVQIVNLKKSSIETRIVKVEYIKRMTDISITLAFAPLKGLRNDFIIEKGTELGVVQFMPFISRYSVVRSLGQSKWQRFKKIAISAMLQSGQYYIPEIIFNKDVMSLVKHFADFNLVVCAHKDGEISLPVNVKRILYIVGPEGGFDKKELNIFKHNGVRLLSLGKNRLRSETAAIGGITKILTVLKKL